MKVKKFLVFSAILSVGGYGAYWYFKNKKTKVSSSLIASTTTKATTPTKTSATTTTQSGGVKTDKVLNSASVKTDTHDITSGGLVRQVNTDLEKRQYDMAVALKNEIAVINTARWNCAVDVGRRFLNQERYSEEQEQALACKQLDSEKERDILAKLNQVGYKLENGNLYKITY